MKIHLAALALTLGTLATACDVDGSEPLGSAQYRGEDLDPPTRPTGTGLVAKGGHDNPEEMMWHPYDRAPEEYKLAFELQVQQQAMKVIEEEFLADERNIDECPAVCDEMHMVWEGGVFIADLQVRFDQVFTEVAREGEFEGRPCWVTYAEAGANVGCGCV